MARLLLVAGFLLSIVDKPTIKCMCAYIAVASIKNILSSLKSNQPRAMCTGTGMLYSMRVMQWKP